MENNFFLPNAGAQVTKLAIKLGMIIIAALLMLFDPLKSGKSSVKHRSSEMQVTAVELQVNENCLKNWQTLQATFPAYH